MEVILTKRKKIRILKKIKLKITKIALLTTVIGGLLGFLFFVLINFATDISTTEINPLFTTSYGMLLGAFMSIRRS